MKESSVIEPINYGPAGITMNAEDKLTTIEFGLIVGEDVKITPLQISGVETHECEFDENKNKAKRRFKNGATMEVSSEKMKKTRDARKAQGRPITEVKENEGLDMEI